MSVIAKSELQSLTTPWAGVVQSGAHEFVTDKPSQFGGQDLGAAPYDLLTASLASCTMITLRMYAQHKSIVLSDFKVIVEFLLNREGEEKIVRQLKFSQALDAKLQAKLLQICEKTPVTLTLKRSVDIQTSIVE